jgi:hypothetical protein
MTLEPTCKTQERAKLLVLQSRALIETVSSLITDARPHRPGNSEEK